MKGEMAWAGLSSVAYPSSALCPESARLLGAGFAGLSNKYNYDNTLLYSNA